MILVHFSMNVLTIIVLSSYSERLVQHRGGVLPAPLQRCSLWPSIHQLQPGALLEPFRRRSSRAALLAVFIHLLSSFFLQRTHYHFQSLYRAGEWKIVSSLVRMNAEAFGFYKHENKFLFS